MFLLNQPTKPDQHGEQFAGAGVQTGTQARDLPITAIRSEAITTTELITDLAIAAMPLHFGAKLAAGLKTERVSGFVYVSPDEALR